MPEPILLFAACGIYFLSFLLLILFTFMMEKDALWLIGTALFIFGGILLKDAIITSFISILFSLVMLVIFSFKRDILYAVSMVFVILGGVAGSIFENWWLFVLLPMVIAALIIKYMPPGTEKEQEVIDEPIK